MAQPIIAVLDFIKLPHTGGPGWVPWEDEPISNITDSIPNILSRACNKQADSLFNWGLQNNNIEQSFILVSKNGLIYPKNYTKGMPNGDKTRVNYTLSSGESLVAYFHTHPSDNDFKYNSFFSFNDIQEARKNAAIQNFAAIIECGNKRFVLVIEEPLKLNAFLNINRLQELKKLKLEEMTYNSAIYKTNAQQASINAVISYFGASSICGIRFYEATAPNKTNFIKLN